MPPDQTPPSPVSTEDEEWCPELNPPFVEIDEEEEWEWENEGWGMLGNGNDGSEGKNDEEDDEGFSMSAFGNLSPTLSRGTIALTPFPMVDGMLFRVTELTNLSPRFSPKRLTALVSCKRSGQAG